MQDILGVMFLYMDNFQTNPVNILKPKLDFQIRKARHLVEETRDPLIRFIGQKNFQHAYSVNLPGFLNSYFSKFKFFSVHMWVIISERVMSGVTLRTNNWLLGRWTCSRNVLRKDWGTWKRVQIWIWNFKFKLDNINSFVFLEIPVALFPYSETFSLRLWR